MKCSRPSFRNVLLLCVIVLSVVGLCQVIGTSTLKPFIAESRYVLSQAALPWLILAVGVYLLSILFSVLSWHAVLRMLQHPVSVPQLILILMAGVFVNNTTPMSRAGGEVVRIYGLHERAGLPYTTAILSVLLSKLTETVSISVLVGLSAWALVQHHVFTWEQFILAGTVLCLLIAVAAWIGNRKQWLSATWSRTLHYLTKRGQLRGQHASLDSYPQPIVQRKELLESLFFAAMLWGLAVVRIEMLAYALRIELPVTSAAAATVGSVLFGLLALTPGGLGILEGGLTGCFVLLGLTPSEALALALLERSISYGLATGIGMISLFALGGQRFYVKRADESGRRRPNTSGHSQQE